MAGQDDISIAVRLRDARRAASDAQSVAKGVRAIGDAGTRAATGTSRATRGLHALDRQARRTHLSLGNLARIGAGFGAGWGVTRGIGAAIGAGIKYNRVIDRQNVGFTTLLHSHRQAADFMRQIQTLAIKSPILDVQTTGDAARTVLAYGINIKRVLPLVKALGDMSAASGKDIQEVMPLGAMAIGQVASKGRLQAQELNQLAQSVGLSRKAIAKQLGMTPKEFENSFKAGHEISAAKAVPAIQAAMVAQSKGAADMLAKTTEGRLQQAQELLAKRMGILIRPVYDETGRVVGKLATDLNVIWGRGGSFESKLKETGDAIRHDVGPMVKQFEDAWRRNHVGARISDAVDAAAPKVLSAVATMGTKATWTFVKAWWHSGVWTKLLTAGFLIHRVGGFAAFGGWAARKAASAFMRRFAAENVAEGVAATMAGEGAAAGAAGKASRWSRVGRGWGRLAGIGFVAGFALAIPDIAQLIADNVTIPLARALGLGKHDKSPQQRIDDFLATHPNRHPIGGPARSRSRFPHPGSTPGLTQHPTAPRRARPRAHAGSLEIAATHDPINMDGTKVGEVTTRVHLRRRER